MCSVPRLGASLFTRENESPITLVMSKRENNHYKSAPVSIIKGNFTGAHKSHTCMRECNPRSFYAALSNHA